MMHSKLVNTQIMDKRDHSRPHRSKLETMRGGGGERKPRPREGTYTGSIYMAVAMPLPRPLMFRRVAAAAEPPPRPRERGVGAEPPPRPSERAALLHTCVYVLVTDTCYKRVSIRLCIVCDISKGTSVMPFFHIVVPLPISILKMTGRVQINSSNAHYFC